MINRLHVYVKNKDAFAAYCKSRGWNVSKTIQKVIDLIMSGQLDPFEKSEVKNDRD